MKSCLIRPAAISAGELQNAVGLGFRANSRNEKRRADILERGVNSVDQQLHHDRLMRPGHDQTGPAFRDQIVGHFRQPVVVESHSALRRCESGDDGARPRILGRGGDFSGKGIARKRESGSPDNAADDPPSRR